MPTVRHVFTLDYVAGILNEHPDLIAAIVSNDDNLSYGSIITVCAGPDDYMTAITDDGIDELRDVIADFRRDELRDVIADFRRSPEEWDAFLRSVIDDPETIENVKTHKAR